jgi:hypothetical protein
MGWLLESFDPVSRSILQALLNSIVPGLMVVVVTWFSLRSAGKTSAATRHAIWLVALIAITAIPFLQGTALNSKRDAVSVSQFAPSAFGRVVENLSVASTMITPIFRETDAMPRTTTAVGRAASEPAASRVRRSRSPSDHNHQRVATALEGAFRRFCSPSGQRSQQDSSRALSGVTCSCCVFVAAWCR